MKKLILSALMLVAFSTISMAKTDDTNIIKIDFQIENSDIEVICSPECENLASAKMARFESINGCEDNADLYNAKWRMYYGMCERGAF